MSREITYRAIILKTSAFDEADEIITFFSQEAGKVRALAKAIKRPESKLRYALQPAMISSITATESSKLPKIIRAQPVESFPNILTEEGRVASWFVIAELSIRGTADEQKNLPLYEAIAAALRQINDIDTSKLEMVVAKWKLLFLDALGFGLSLADQPKYFSNRTGGFEVTKSGADSIKISESTWQAYQTLAANPLSNLGAMEPIKVIELDQLLTDFIEYQLERKIQSQNFFKQSM